MYIPAFTALFVVCIYVQHFFHVVRSQTLKTSTTVNQKKIKRSCKECGT